MDKSVLDKMTEDERSLITSLPYRAGLWVSMCDDTGGGEAEEKEIQALNNIVIGFSQMVFGSELLQYIMDETVKRKGEWHEWKNGIDKVPDECVDALNILRDHVDDKEVNAYAQRLIEIGEAVALAFREYEQQSFKDKLNVYSSYIVSTFKANLKKQPSKSFEQFLNISLSERRALTALADALDTRYSI